MYSKQQCVLSTLASVYTCFHENASTNLCDFSLIELLYEITNSVFCTVTAIILPVYKTTHRSRKINNNRVSSSHAVVASMSHYRHGIERLRPTYMSHISIAATERIIIRLQSAAIIMVGMGRKCMTALCMFNDR